MKRWLKRAAQVVLPSILIVLLVSIPVLAATFYMPIQVIESGSNSYTALPIIADIDNDYLASNGYIFPTGLDTRVTLGETTLAHMVVDDKLLFVSDIAADSVNNLEYSFGGSALSSFETIVGYGGYITTGDNAALELGNNFEVEVSGYIDTSAGNSKRLTYKPGAFELYVSGAQEITAAVLAATWTDPTGFTDGDAAWVNEVNVYDGNTATFATEAAVVAESWSSILALTVGATDTSYVRYWAGGIDANITKIDLDVFYGGAWHDVYEGTFTQGVWETKILTEGTQSVTQMRISLWNNHGAIAKDAYLYEVDFGDDTEGSVITAQGVTSGEHTIKAVSDATTFSIFVDGESAQAIRALDYVDIKDLGWNNNNWNDVDISAYVPSGANGAILVVVNNHNASLAEFGLRQNGSAETKNDNRIYGTDALEGGRAQWWMVELDGTLKFEIFLNGAATWQNALFYVYLVGYTTSDEVTYLDPYPDYSLAGAIDVWADIDCTPDAPNAIGLIFLVENSAAADWRYGFRYKGSTDGRTNTQINKGYSMFIVGCDAAGANDQVVQGFYGNAAVDFFLIGYITAGAYFYVNAPEIGGVIGLNSWEDIDLSGYSQLSWAIVEMTPANPVYNRMLRENESTIQTLSSTCQWHHSFVIHADDNQIIEGYKNTLQGNDWYLTGYFTDAGVVSTAVPDTDTDWYINLNNVTPNIGFYKLSVGGTLKAWYQPNTIIINTSYDGTADAGGTDSTLIDAELTQVDNYWNWALLTINTGGVAGETSIITDFEDARDTLSFSTLTGIVGAGDTYTVEFATLIDREAPVQNGIIVWGVSPVGIAAIPSSIVSTAQPSFATTEEQAPLDVMPEIGTSDWYVDPDISGSLLTNPLRPFVTMISDNTTITELQTWRWLGMAIVLLVTVVAARLVRKHLVIACFAGGTATMLMVVLTIWPLWTLVLIFLFAIGGWVSERSPSV